MTAPGKLKVEADGRVTGPANITYNDPFPCVNGGWGSGAMNGVVMHTMVGNLDGCIAWFNNPASSVSAHFGIAQDGSIHQFGPIGKGWCAWAEAAGNMAWYSIEHADDGNPDNPLTEAQIVASAQLYECLSGFAGFPVQEANSPDEFGYGVHYMGGQSWGGHTCPDVPPEHVRSQQRPAILAVVREMRTPPPPPPPTTKLVVVAGTADGKLTLKGLFDVDSHNTPAAVIELTLGSDETHKFGGGLGEYVDNADWAAPLPEGCPIWYYKEEKVA